MTEESTLPERESMHDDVIVVGAGPAGLTVAIRLKSLKPISLLSSWKKARRSARISSPEV